jgi:predicted nucleic acid-binding protein
VTVELTGPVWDASVMSLAHPTGAHHDLYWRTAAAHGAVVVAAPALFEVRRGALDRVADERFQRQLAWLDREEQAGRLSVAPFDGVAAAAAAYVRARHPLPPSPRRRAVGTPDARVGWVMDIMIGACAWAQARDVLTRHVVDLEVVAGELAEVWPMAPLVVVGPGD